MTRARDHLVVSLHRSAVPRGGSAVARRARRVATRGPRGALRRTARSPLRPESGDRSPRARASRPRPRGPAATPEAFSPLARRARRGSRHAARTADEHRRDRARRTAAGPNRGPVRRSWATSEDEPADQARWGSRRAATSLGRAVHGVLQRVDLGGGGPRGARGRRGVREGCAERAGEVATLVRSALAAPVVVAAAAAREVLAGAARHGPGRRRACSRASSTCASSTVTASSSSTTRRTCSRARRRCRPRPAATGCRPGRTRSRSARRSAGRSTGSSSSSSRPPSGAVEYEVDDARRRGGRGARPSSPPRWRDRVRVMRRPPPGSGRQPTLPGRGGPDGGGRPRVGSPPSSPAVARRAQGQLTMADAVAAAIAAGRAPLGRRGHRDRQVARLPRPRGALGRARRRGDGDKGPPGPARCTRTSRSSRAGLRRFSSTRAERPLELPLRAAADESRLAGIQGSLDRRATTRRHEARREARRIFAWAETGPRRATGPSSTAEPDQRLWSTFSVTRGRVPRRLPLPVGGRVLRRAGPGGGDGGGHRRREPPSARRRHRQRTAPFCPSTTCSSSTRPTRSRTS